MGWEWGDEKKSKKKDLRSAQGNKSEKECGVYAAIAGAVSSFLRATKMLFNAPSQRASDSSSGAQSRYVFSSAMSCRQNLFDRDIGSTSAASMT